MDSRQIQQHKDALEECVQPSMKEPRERNLAEHGLQGGAGGNAGGNAGAVAVNAGAHVPNPLLRGINPSELQSLLGANISESSQKLYTLSDDQTQKLYAPAFDGDQYAISGVDCSQFLDFTHKDPIVKNRPLAMLKMCGSLRKRAPQLVLSCHNSSDKDPRAYASKRWDGGTQLSEASRVLTPSDTSGASDSGGVASDSGVLSNPVAVVRKEKRRRWVKGLLTDPDWWFRCRCTCPRCPCNFLIGGSYRYAPRGPGDKTPPVPVGIEDTLRMWSSTAGFEGDGLRKMQLCGSCVHEHVSETGGTPNYGTMPREVAAKLAEEVPMGGNARALYNSRLAAMTPEEILTGNTSQVGRNRKAVNAVVQRARKKEREKEGWRDDMARLDVFRKEEVARECAELPPEPDAAKRAKRVVGPVQAIKYYPRGFVLFNEPLLVLYRMSAPLPEGLCGDYTAQVLRKVKVVEPGGDEVLKHQLLFCLSCPNPWAGETEALKGQGAPPIVLMRAVSTSGTMEELKAQFGVLVAAELRRFGNNVQPARFFTDCSKPETGAVCQTYNHMPTEDFCNVRVRQVYTKQPCVNPISGASLTECVWCNSHVMHALSQFPKKKLQGRGEHSNKTKNLLSQYLLAMGQHLTHVHPDFVNLVLWLKIIYTFIITRDLPTPGAGGELYNMDVSRVGTDPKLPPMRSAKVQELRAKDILEWSYEEHGCLSLGWLIGAPRAGVFPNPDAPTLSPQEALTRFGPFVTVKQVVPSPSSERVIEFGIPLFGILVQVPGDLSSNTFKNPLCSPAVATYFKTQWLPYLPLWCQGTFCSESRFNSNIHSEIVNFIEKILELQGIQGLSVRRFVEHAVVAMKASVVRLLHLVTAVLSAGKKTQNAQLLQSLFNAVPEPADSDADDERPPSMPRKRTPAELLQLELAHSYVSAGPTTDRQAFSLRSTQRKEIHKRCKSTVPQEYEGDLWLPQSKTVNRDAGVLRLSWLRLSDEDLFPGSPRARASTLLTAVAGIEKAASPTGGGETELWGAVRELECEEVRSPERKKKKAVRKSGAGHSAAPGMFWATGQSVGGQPGRATGESAPGYNGAAGHTGESRSGQSSLAADNTSSALPVETTCTSKGSVEESREGGRGFWTNLLLEEDDEPAPGVTCLSGGVPLKDSGGIPPPEDSALGIPPPGNQLTPDWQESDGEDGEAPASDKDESDGGGTDEGATDEGVPFIDTQEALHSLDEGTRDETPLEAGSAYLLAPGSEGWDRPSKTKRKRSQRKMKPLFIGSWTP